MESFYFSRGRLSDVIELPYNFCSIGLVAGNPDKSDADRYGGGGVKKSVDVRPQSSRYERRRGDEGFDNFFDSWDKETQLFVLLLKETN
jgi:hypothetical protein